MGIALQMLSAGVCGLSIYCENYLAKCVMNPLLGMVSCERPDWRHFCRCEVREHGCWKQAMLPNPKFETLVLVALSGGFGLKVLRILSVCGRLTYVTKTRVLLTGVIAELRPPPFKQLCHIYIYIMIAMIPP